MPTDVQMICGNFQVHAVPKTSMPGCRGSISHVSKQLLCPCSWLDMVDCEGIQPHTSPHQKGYVTADSDIHFSDRSCNQSACAFFECHPPCPGQTRQPELLRQHISCS